MTPSKIEALKIIQSIGRVHPSKLPRNLTAIRAQQIMAAHVRGLIESGLVRYCNKGYELTGTGHKMLRAHSGEIADPVSSRRLPI